jgi:hypothetical protein
VHGSTGGATGAGFGLLYLLFRIAFLHPSVLAGAPPEAHAGIAFETRYFGYNKRQKVKNR